ncbi:MAG: PQQ-binding-like beta-propeller repeat protein [Planctomycetota bacterium]
MMHSPIPVRRTLARTTPGFLAMFAVGWIFFPGTSSLRAQVNDQTIAPAGLEVHWEGSLGGAGLTRSEHSMAVWAHSTERREYVDVMQGNRLVERIDARQVDRNVLDRLILEGKPTKPAPLLGMKGAQERAAKLINTYGIIGRKLTTRSFSEPVVYVVTLASNGILTAFDGESGEVLWQTSLPHTELQMLGPGVSDDYVTVVNGNYYFVMGMKDGNLVATRKLEHTPISAPIPVESKILVPSTGGRLVAYDIGNPLLSPIILRAGRDNMNGTVLSADHHFLAWSNQKSLFMVQCQRKPVMWAKVNTNEDVQSRPVATPEGFIFASNNGTIVHASTQRTGSYLWRSNISLQTGRPPVVGNDRVFVVSDDGQVQSLDLKSGAILWPTTTKNVDSILGVGKEHIYARNTSGMLQSIRIADGKIDGRTTALLQGIVPNSVHDRFFVVTRNGHISCLREKGAVVPTMWIRSDEKPASKTTESKPSSSSERPKPALDDDPFGPDTKSAPANDSSKDPFDPF